MASAIRAVNIQALWKVIVAPEIAGASADVAACEIEEP